MNLKTKIISISAFATSVFVSNGATIFINGAPKNYELVQQDGTYEEALAAIDSMTKVIDGVLYRATLATVETREEYDLITQMGGAEEWGVYWVGLSYDLIEGKAMWSNGNEFDGSWANWLGAPGASTPYGAILGWGYDWDNDLQFAWYDGAQSRGGFVVEYTAVAIPEPSYAVLFGFGALVPVITRRRRS